MLMQNKVTEIQFDLFNPEPPTLINPNPTHHRLIQTQPRTINIDPETINRSSPSSPTAAVAAKREKEEEIDSGKRWFGWLRLPWLGLRGGVGSGGSGLVFEIVVPKVSAFPGSMDSGDITRLCASLSLIEREGPVRKLDEKLKMGAMQKLSVSLVGKILTKKFVNREAFMRVIAKIWHISKGVAIESLTGNIFSFHFTNQEDRCKVLFGAPWTFDNSLLVLEKPEGKGLVENLAFNDYEF
ncbi:hypothetical protein EZV62_022428 [Acer yangbiense]|uniref:DUF4283 domain-containing protein n=1 Tax=Acer yangbiense TaxID=1000413 RepID=A0A5C7H932_9ROSI|nr:hypothetical protein EZV62_022428 [Acer yangbiense]